MSDGWHDVCDEADLWEGDMMGVQVAGNAVLLVRDAEAVRAFRDVCPHQENPLHTGVLDEEILVCEFHNWMFDTTTGEAINPVGECLTLYEARVSGDRIEVRFPAI